VSLAELRALPRPAEPVAAAEPAGSTPGTAPAGVPAALQHQIARLQDEDPATRFEAVDELLRSRDMTMLEHLLPMAKDGDTFVRRLTVEGLRDFRAPEVVDALLVALADPEEIVRDTAWRSLKELTGQKLPFEATAARDVRARAQQKWQEWWDKNRGTFGG
jgi:HEAT repeat protein